MSHDLFILYIYFAFLVSYYSKNTYSYHRACFCSHEPDKIMFHPIPIRIRNNKIKSTLNSENSFHDS